MIQKQTKLVVADNSGAKVVQVFHIIGSTGKMIARLGDIVKCAVKKAIPGGKVKKGQIVTGVIVRVVKEARRADGSYISFGDNALVLIEGIENMAPIGTRIFGPVARELKAKGEFSAILSLAPEVV